MDRAPLPALPIHTAITRKSEVETAVVEGTGSMIARFLHQDIEIATLDNPAGATRRARCRHGTLPDKSSLPAVETKAERRPGAL